MTQIYLSNLDHFHARQSPYDMRIALPASFREAALSQNRTLQPLDDCTQSLV